MVFIELLTLSAQLNVLKTGTITLARKCFVKMCFPQLRLLSLRDQDLFV